MVMQVNKYMKYHNGTNKIEIVMAIILVVVVVWYAWS